MYRPAAFRDDDLDAQHTLIRERPLGLLVTTGSLGLVADPVPFTLHEGGERGILRAHLARANSQLQALAVAEECLIVFQGPEAYLTPEWYATKRETGKVVPTWNYVAVHAWGRPRIVEDAEWIRAQIDALTDLMEGARSRPWSVDDAPASFVEAQIRGIFGVEIPITRIEGKWKASQNRPENDRQGVVDGLRAEGHEAMASIVARRSDGARQGS